MIDTLKQLFSEMANSIRGGLGDIGTISPTSYPDKIDEIVAMLNNSSGTGSVGNLKYTTGYFTADTDRNRATITHGMEIMPDFVLVQMVGLFMGETSEYLEALPLECAWGFKSTFLFEYTSSFIRPGASFPTNSFGIDNVPVSDRDTGYIYCPDEKTFQVGASSTEDRAGKLVYHDGVGYRWIAISGLGKAVAPVLQDKTVTENGTYTADSGFDGLGSVTVEVAGSGSGSLDPGCYWKQSDHILNLNYIQNHFELNNTLYVQVYNKTEAKDQIYKLTSNGYELAYEFDSTGIALQGNLVKHKDCVHCVQTSYSEHFKLDGETCTELAEAPDNRNIYGAFDFDGDLCYLGEYGNLYKYVDADDSWIDTGLLTAETMRVYADFMFAHNGDIYRLNDGKLYKYVDGVSTLVQDFGITDTGNEILVNGVLYFTRTTGCSQLYKYNVDTGVLTNLGLSPYLTTYSRFFEYDGKLNLASGNSTYQQHLIMYEVTE